MINSGNPGTPCQYGKAAPGFACAQPGLRSTTSRTSQRNLPHLLCLRGTGAHQEGEVGPGGDIAGAHSHVFLDELRARRKSADADVLAMAAACRDRRLVGLAHLRMLVLLRNAPVAQEIVGADHHHVDALNPDDLLSL